MTLSSTIVSSEVDWDAAVAAAEGLGRITLVRVAERDADAVRDWCLQMSRVHVGEGNALRALSYLELAVLTGHRDVEVASLAGRGWDELVQAAEQNLAAVRKLANEAVEAKKATAAEAKDAGGEQVGLVEAAEDEEAGA
jgi:hypothetical protein